MVGHANEVCIMLCMPLLCEDIAAGWPDRSPICTTVLHDLQEGKELQAKAKAEAAVRNDAIKAQLARQLADRAQQEQQEKQEEMEYAQLEQVRSAVLGQRTIGCALSTWPIRDDFATCRRQL